LQQSFINDRINILPDCFILSNKGDIPMKESNLKLAQQDIDDALKTVEDMELYINNSELQKDILKEKFITLSEKVQQLEDLLKMEGIL
jgi:hypothetical protein